MNLLPPPGPERRRQLTWLLILVMVVGALAVVPVRRPHGPG